jgi:hypothetical protein
MTLAEALRAKLADWTPAGGGRHSLSHTDPDVGWAVAVAADRTDTVGCLAWELSATRTGPAPAGVTQRQWADRIADRATGLMEPLRVLEVDATQGEAVLRSDGPAVSGDAVKYYEVRLHGTERATVRRYEASKTQGGRSQVPFAVTHEAVAKLAGDICG